jgi:excisionase family DNA binding protein
MTDGQLENDGERGPKSALSIANGPEVNAVPFVERLSCTIDEACEATGLGRTKLYELIGAGQLITTTVGRRRLVMVRSLIALLGTARSA